jgi:hypothetical protein
MKKDKPIEPERLERIVVVTCSPPTLGDASSIFESFPMFEEDFSSDYRLIFLQKILKFR